MSSIRRVAERSDVLFRAASAALRKLPDFVVVGGMKCGTTALFRYLVEHPMILGSSVKEVHFFDHEYQRGVGWYRRHFPLRAPSGARVGEASPYYLFHPTAVARIASTVPAVKLIALLRDPVARARSHYEHCRRRGFEPLAFADAIAREPERLEGEEERLKRDPHYRSHRHSRFSYVARGVYWRQVERMYSHFDRQQVLLVRSEDLFSDTHSVMEQVFSFLGLAPLGSTTFTPRNVGGYEQKDTETLERLRDLFVPHNERLRQLTGRDWAWESARGR